MNQNFCRKTKNSATTLSGNCYYNNKNNNNELRIDELQYEVNRQQFYGGMPIVGSYLYLKKEEKKIKIVDKLVQE